MTQDVTFFVARQLLCGIGGVIAVWLGGNVMGLGGSAGMLLTIMGHDHAIFFFFVGYRQMKTGCKITAEPHKQKEQWFSSKSS